MKSGVNGVARGESVLLVLRFKSLKGRARSNRTASECDILSRSGSANRLSENGHDVPNNFGTSNQSTWRWWHSEYGPSLPFSNYTAY